MRSFFIFVILIFSVASYGFDKMDSCELISQQDVSTVTGVEPPEAVVTLVYPEDIFENTETNSETSTDYDQPLLEAIQNENIQLVCVLLVKGANVNAIGEGGDTPLIKAIKNNEDEIAKLILFHPDVDVNIQNDVNSTALIESIRAKLDGISLSLLDREEINVNQVGDRWNWSALNWALEGKHIKVSDKLLSRSDIEINPRVIGTEPAIMIASLRSWKIGYGVVDKVLKHPNLNAGLQDNDGENALIAAARHGNLRLVNALLKRDDVDVNQYMFLSGSTPLSMAAAFGQVHVMDALLKVPGINVNNNHVHFTDRYGPITPLIEASYMGHTSIIKKLLAIPNIDSIATDGAGNTAFDYAIQMKHTEIADLLKAHMNENVDLNKLESTIQIRCANGFAEAVPMILRNIDKVHCAEPNWKLTQESVDEWLENMQTRLEAIKSVD